MLAGLGIVCDGGAGEGARTVVGGGGVKAGCGAGVGVGSQLFGTTHIMYCGFIFFRLSCTKLHHRSKVGYTKYRVDDFVKF